jgi:tetratricopeptide (TPR) repeat protein
VNETAYNQYRDALRAGHLAVMGGAFDRAIRAYGEAARTQPGRAAPHVALGKAYLATGHPDDALRSFEAAVGRSPDDVVALNGAARALVELDRQGDAADLLDRIAAIHHEHGRQGEAIASLERAVEIANSPWRRLMLEQLGGQQADATGRELPWLPDMPVPGEMPVARTAADDVARPIADDLRDVAEAVEAARRRDDVPGLVAGAVALARAGRLRAGAVACQDALLIAPADPDVHRALAEIYRRRGWDGASRRKLRIVDRYQRIVDDPDELDREAESALVTGDMDELLRVVQQHADYGRSATALDLLLAALAVTPGDPRLYLAIVRLHLARGWRGRAVKELDRLVRLADATGDTASREAIAAFLNDLLRTGVGKPAPAH